MTGPRGRAYQLKQGSLLLSPVSLFSTPAALLGAEFNGIQFKPSLIFEHKLQRRGYTGHVKIDGVLIKPGCDRCSFSELDPLRKMVTRRFRWEELLF